jgi:hypothetical protein
VDFGAEPAREAALRKDARHQEGRYSVQPPSITIAWPVTKALSSLAR